MGNCISDDVHHAIQLDGQENVKNAAILTAGQKFIDNFVQQIIPTLETHLKKNEKLKFQQIEDSRKLIDQMLQDKKIQLETKETGTVEFLVTRHNKSFQKISGYADAVSRIDDFQKRVKQTYQAQQNKIIQDINKYKEDLKSQLEESKQPLPALMAFGLEQKQIILQEVAKLHQEDVQKWNKRLQQQIKKQFQFQKLHRKRVEYLVPSSQLNEILENFKNSLLKIQSKKSNFFSCF